MKQEDRLKEVFGKDAGWRVPEGYFDSFHNDILENLPPYKAAEKIKVSAWQRVKPYLYLAAMFAGIWMMMKVFHNVYEDATMNIDNPPEHIAMLMASDPDLDLYATLPSSDDDFDALIGSYDNISDLERDMGIMDPSSESRGSGETEE